MAVMFGGGGRTGYNYIDVTLILVSRARSDPAIYTKSEKGSGVCMRLSPGQIFGLPIKLQENGHMTPW